MILTLYRHANDFNFRSKSINNSVIVSDSIYSQLSERKIITPYIFPSLSDTFYHIVYLEEFSAHIFIYSRDELTGSGHAPSPTTHPQKALKSRLFFSGKI